MVAEYLLIAVNDSIPTEPVLVDNTGTTEIILVRIKESLLLGCYQCPPMDAKQYQSSRDLRTTKRFPGDHIILLVGDMNMSEINWSVPAVKPTFAQKKVDKDFLSTLAQCDMKQLVTDSTYIHGNTLDL